MSVKKISTSYISQGKIQLGEVIGKIRVGDTCQFHMVGTIVCSNTGTSNDSKPRGWWCIPKFNDTEFIDTGHVGKQLTMEIRENGVKTYDGLYRGLNDAMKDMIFGEESTFLIPSCLAFGSDGLSKCSIGSHRPKDHDGRNPAGVSFLQIEPDSDLQVKILVQGVGRNGEWHRRAMVNGPVSGWAM
ncbi:expressed unknown protein [Seminavis robusta]|uniref:peptidylprolyl isomerase n=1 Tax=Seminavis robusta TaxID=568900 RepID=A0A9N8EGL9_9STRA|nr:expressed unknown protein [Seminavis robusta]|eukprot:Sro1098_g241000.1 n/a (186) ;mRNA; f:24048-24705